MYKTLKSAYERNSEAFVVCEWDDGDFTISEIQSSNYWVGGRKGGYTNDSNLYFDTLEYAGQWYERKYKNVWFFDNSEDAEEFIYAQNNKI